MIYILPVLPEAANKTSQTACGDSTPQNTDVTMLDTCVYVRNDWGHGFTASIMHMKTHFIPSLLLSRHVLMMATDELCINSLHLDCGMCTNNCAFTRV